MNLHVLPFTTNIPIDLSAFEINGIEPQAPIPYESFILFTYKEQPLLVGLRTLVQASDENNKLYFKPQNKVYYRSMASLDSSEELDVLSLQPNPNLDNVTNTSELDSYANQVLADIDDRAAYYKLSTQEAIEFLLQKQDQLYAMKHRLATLVPGSSEYNNLSTYLETIKNLPTNLEPVTVDKTRIKNLVSILPVAETTKEDLYISIQYSLLVRKHSILPLLLTGPPGVGKTTFAQQLSALLGVPSKICSLGNIVDKNYLVGFPRTYANSSPGILIQNLIGSKCLNPIIVFDELDKTSKDIQNIFLALLDGSQNKAWVDTYINRPVDVSQITFVFTCNDKEKLSSPLRDRLLEIEFRHYTKSELSNLIETQLIPTVASSLQINNYTVASTVIQTLSEEQSLRQIEKSLKLLFTKSYLNNTGALVEINDCPHPSSKNRSTIGF